MGPEKLFPGQGTRSPSTARTGEDHPAFSHCVPPLGPLVPAFAVRPSGRYALPQPRVISTAVPFIVAIRFSRRCSCTGAILRIISIRLLEAFALHQVYTLSASGALLLVISTHVLELSAFP